jgi:2'-5' RNA ligase
MSEPHYALLTYVRSPIGHFVEELRRELHPELPHMSAHVTILPPRSLHGSESAALDFLEEALSHVIPFDLELGEVETFLPVTPTIFIQVKRAAYRLRELHDQLSCKALGCEEEWPYMPHLTIVKMEREEQARTAFEYARRRWEEFSGSRQVHVSELVFVREQNGTWKDVASIPLGRSLLSPRP